MEEIRTTAFGRRDARKYAQAFEDGRSCISVYEEGCAYTVAPYGDGAVERVGDFSYDRMELSDEPCERCHYVERRTRGSHAFFTDFFGARRDFAQGPSIDCHFIVYLSLTLAGSCVRAIVAGIRDLSEALCTVASCDSYFVFRCFADFFR